jgi:hypothetical protein
LHLTSILGFILVIIGVLLLLHHGCKHAADPPDSAARVDSCAEACYFQLTDIANHETWILICFTNALSLRGENEREIARGLP